MAKAHYFAGLIDLWAITKIAHCHFVKYYYIVITHQNWYSNSTSFLYSVFNNF